MIYTSSYDNYKDGEYEKYSISGDRGKKANYEGKCYPKLAPKKEFWTVWHNNIGKISEEENLKYYIREYYIEVLSELDPEEVYKELDNSVLLCYEDIDEFCHRDIVSAWLELFLVGVKVDEIKNGKTFERPNHQKIKYYLEKVIKSSINMEEHNDLRSLYLTQKNKKKYIK